MRKKALLLATIVFLCFTSLGGSWAESLADKEVHVYSSYGESYVLKEDISKLTERKITDEFINLNALWRYDLAFEKTANDKVFLRNEKQESWYMNQNNTGKYSRVNCVPTSISMALKWSKKSSDITPEDIRNSSDTELGWVPREMFEYIKNIGLKYEVQEYKSIDQIKDELRAGNILMVCLDVKYLGFYGGGHCIIIHDYLEDEGDITFITHDPDLGGEMMGGKYIGENKAYRSESINNGINNWLSKIVIIKKEI